MADETPEQRDERAWLREHIALILCNRYQFPVTEIAHLKGWAESALREADELIDLVRAYEAGMADYWSGGDLSEAAAANERTGLAYRSGVNAARERADAVGLPEETEADRG